MTIAKSDNKVLVYLFMISAGSVALVKSIPYVFATAVTLDLHITSAGLGHHKMASPSTGRIQ